LTGFKFSRTRAISRVWEYGGMGVWERNLNSIYFHLLFQKKVLGFRL
jgi:hypothetical protein